MALTHKKNQYQNGTCDWLFRADAMHEQFLQIDNVEVVLSYMSRNWIF